MVANAIASSLAMARRKRSSAGGLPLAGQTRVPQLIGDLVGGIARNPSVYGVF